MRCWSALLLALTPLLAGCTTLGRGEGSASLILHYVRSNQDGSEPENVVHYRPGPMDVAVYKWVEKCTTAAYVTARMSEDVREGLSFVAGKVARDGSQAVFGKLTLDRASSALTLDMQPPGGQPVRASHPLQRRPYLLYDFDFADLNAFLQQHKPADGFTFDLPVIWPSDAGLFRNLGTLTARRRGEERHLGRQTIRFDLRIDGPSASRGTLWIDRRLGFIVDATLGLPNHQEYRDFRLRLRTVEPGSEQAWRRLLRGHYRDCSATTKA